MDSCPQEIIILVMKFTQCSVLFFTEFSEDSPGGPGNKTTPYFADGIESDLHWVLQPHCTSHSPGEWLTY